VASDGGCSGDADCADASPVAAMTKADANNICLIPMFVMLITAEPSVIQHHTDTAELYGAKPTNCI
jgi:hypothetical protein